MTTTRTNAKYTAQGGYTLRSHKEQGGEETVRMQGTLCRDGKPIADYRNDGTGGSSIISFDDRSEREHFADFARSLPPVPVEGTGTGLAMDGDFFLTLLASEYTLNKKIARASKTKTCFLLPGEDVSKVWREIRAIGAEAEAYLNKKYGPHGWDLLVPWEAK